MANKGLFKGASPGKSIPKTDAVNEAGGVAYAFGPEAALAQYAVTGCLNDTFYASAKDQLETTLKLARECGSEFIAKTAVYARESGFMKDMPALLCAMLAGPGRQDADSRALLRKIFPRVIDNGKMLQNFAQIVRSGTVGRKSFGHGPKKLMQNWLNGHDCDWLFRNSIGQDPSLADIVKLVRPKGVDPEHDAFFGYLIGKVSMKEGGKAEALPGLVKEFEAWKRDRDLPPPKVPFQMLTAQPLSTAQWATIFRQGNWHFTRMNLNTAARHGVFKEFPDVVDIVADRLRDAVAIRRAKVFPYQLLMTYLAVKDEVPRKVVDALHDALEIAVENVPAIEGNVVIFPDVSGSMASPVTGDRGSATTAVRCIDVAALFSAAVLRQNREARVVPIDTRVHLDYRPEPRDSIMTNAARLARFGGGGTALGIALQWLNGEMIPADVVVFVSDNQSWADQQMAGSLAFVQGQNKSLMMEEFRKLQQRRPNAKLVCVDIQPYGTTQASDERGAILNVGGWSDQVFNVISAFVRGNPNEWVDTIKAVVI
jgi:60 kDa SS-A/Ro ribonucleoprotein